MVSFGHYVLFGEKQETVPSPFTQFCRGTRSFLCAYQSCRSRLAQPPVGKRDLYTRAR
jgi:hypothetical protein